MKLKDERISLKNLLIIVDRFISLNSSYRYFTNKFKINIEDLNKLLDIPVVIFLQNGSTFINKNTINIEGIENLITSITLNIEGILNIQQLILMKMQHDYFYQKELQNKIINVIFIEINKEVNHGVNEKLSLFLDLSLATKKNTKSIDIDILEKIFLEEDKKFFHNKFEKSISKHFFPEQRKSQVIKKDVVKNPWLNLYLQHNKNYLGIEKAKANFKEIKIIHCPICAKEYLLSNDLIQILDEKISFFCGHKDTQFLKYSKFSIPLALFQNEDFTNLSKAALQKFFKHNIQPIIINNVYFVALKSKLETTYIPLKNYMKVHKKDIDTIDKYKPTLVIYTCPICGKKHHICFSKKDEDYSDMNEKLYLHYLKLFQINESIVEFLCEHENSVYENYKYFSKKNTKKELMYQSFDMTNSFFGNYLDGKKIVYMVTDSKPYIIDLANFL